MKKYLLIAAISLAIFSCSDDERLSLDERKGNEIVGFNSPSENIAYFEDLGQLPNDIAVVVKGLGDGLSTTAATTITYEVDVVNSTATEGTEFNFATTNRTITIPAGSTFANIPLLVNTGSLNATAKTELVLTLKSADNSTVIDEKFKTIKVLFVGCQTNLQGNYKWFPGANPAVFKAATVTKIAPNVYRSSYFPTFNSIYWFEFSDVCGDLEITDWRFSGGNPLFKTGGGAVTGFVTQPSGNITFTNVNVTGVATYVDRTWTLVKQ